VPLHRHDNPFPHIGPAQRIYGGLEPGDVDLNQDLQRVGQVAPIQFEKPDSEAEAEPRSERSRSSGEVCSKQISSGRPPKWP